VKDVLIRLKALHPAGPVVVVVVAIVVVVVVVDRLGLPTSETACDSSGSPIYCPTNKTQWVFGSPVM